MRGKDGGEATRSLAETAQVPAGAAAAADLGGLKFVILFGPDKGKSVLCRGARFTVGTAPGNDFVLSDPAVSRRHCELESTSSGLLLRDLGSTNGTRLGGCRVESGYVRPGTTIRLGSTLLVLESLHDAPSRGGERSRGRALGKSESMRRIFSIVARVSRYDSTILLEGETGTGKTLLAHTVHKASARKRGPFIVVDCGSIPPNLIETELFGHEKGAFTGALGTRIGSFEAAVGGTIFLDEIGELPLEMQPKLLRILEDRVIKRVGSTEPRHLDVRVIAATNRDLEEATGRGTFRSDLLYRLNTLSIRIPPLRDRPEDIPALADYFYKESTGDPDATLPSELHDELLKHSWPGNARELRSAIERLVVLGDPWPDSAAQGTPPLTQTQELVATGPQEPVLSFREAKEGAVARWEQEYVEKLLQRSKGNLSQAAREVRMDRNYLRELVRRRGLGGNQNPPKP
jgi:DNA-binding NtrC family response regulator